MKRINILITDEQHKSLVERSKRLEKTISEQIRKAISKYLKQVASETTK